jgi:hypothetical protein
MPLLSALRERWNALAQGRLYLAAAAAIALMLVLILRHAPAQRAAFEAVPAAPMAAAARDAVAQLASTETIAAKAQNAPAPGSPAQSAPAPPPLSRDVIKEATIALLVTDVDSTVSGLTSLAQSNGGYVVSLQDSRPSQSGGHREAALRFAVPSGAFDRTLERVASLGQVESRTITASDVTDSLVDTEARLRNLRRTEQDLLGIMDKAAKVSDILDVQNQLTSVREQIERLDAERAAVRRSVSFSTVTVQVGDAVALSAVGVSAGDRLANAWHGALAASADFGLRLLEDVLAAVAFLPYALVIAAVAFIIARARRAHNRGGVSPHVY